jgi:hypothetical protein
MNKATGFVFPLVLVFAGVTPSLCRADAIYTFEAPVFTNGQTTPILNAAPNTNPGTFLASFTDIVKFDAAPSPKVKNDRK